MDRDTGRQPGAATGQAPARFKLTGTECAQCGHRQFPSASVCPRCLSEAQRELSLSPAGRLYSWTVVHVAPRGWQVPYAIGYVDLPEGVRVFAHLGGEPSAFVADMPVQLEPARIGPDDGHGGPVGFRFSPVPEA